MQTTQCADLSENCKAETKIKKKSVVLHIPRRFTKHEWGGTETVIFHMVKTLRNFGYEGIIVTSDLLAKAGNEHMEQLSVKRYSGFYPRWGLSRQAKRQLDFRGGNYFSISLLFSMLFTQNLGVIHLHTGGFMGGMGRLVAKIRGVPYFISVHGGTLALPEKQLQQLLAPLKGSFNWGKILEILFSLKRLYRDASGIICLSEQEKKQLQEKYPGTRVVCMPNGVDYETFANGKATDFRRKYHFAENTPILLCVGSFYEQKNQLNLLTGFHILHKGKHSNARLVMIGVIYDESYWKLIQTKIQEYGLDDSVLLLSNLDYRDADLINAYAAADVFVFPSCYETFGIVVLEAWAAKTPVVCGKVGGIADYGRDRENLSFADISSPESIASKTAEILENPDFADKLANEGHRSAEIYSWNNIARQLTELYQSGRQAV